MKTIMVDGKEYECRRYTAAELEKMLDGKIVVLDDAVPVGTRPESGVLLEVCTSETKDEVALKYLSNGKDFICLDDCGSA